MKKNLLCVAAAIIVPVIFIGLRKNSAPFFSAETYQCVQVHDALLSDDYFSSINNTLADLCKERCAAHVIIDRLQQQFAALKKVVVAYRPSGTRVMISAYEPQCCLNDSFVLTANKNIFSKNIFREDAVADIPNIMCQLTLDVFSRARPELVEGFSSSAPRYPSTGSGRARGDKLNTKENISVLVSHLLQTLPSDVYQTYNLELTNEHCLKFSHKQKPQFVVLSSVTQTKLPQLLTQCESIKQSIAEKKGFDKGATWVADTRFAHYIVAYKA